MVIGYIIWFVVGCRVVVCDFDGLMRYEILGFVFCIIVFLLIYFFGMVLLLWWVILFFIWFLLVGMKWLIEVIINYL